MSSIKHFKELEERSCGRKELKVLTKYSKSK